MDSIAVRFIEQSPWADCLTPTELDRVLATAHERRIAPHEHLVTAGTPARHWIGVIDGLLVQSIGDADGRVASLTAVERDRWFGEGSVMKNECWRYDIVACSAAHAVLVPHATFEWLRERSLPFNHYLTRLLNERLSLYMGLLAAERLACTDVRMARVLASLFDPGVYPHRQAYVALSQGEFASLAGLSRQRANAALQRLQRAGAIRLERCGVTVLDVELLRRFPNDDAPPRHDSGEVPLPGLKAVGLRAA